MTKGVKTGASSKLLTHCRQELIHAAWELLLDDDFVEGYRLGWVIKCEDGVTRRLFPRIFTYSADYPEKCATPFIHEDVV
jgi:hypothetical protein